MSAHLVLENGMAFKGCTPSLLKDTISGEVVFTTGMTGYPESLTDPSYAGQILTFTYPLIGNYGIPQQEKWESAKIHARGIIVSEACHQWSHHAGLISLIEWARQQKVPILTGIDTRALTKVLRSSGTMLGIITAEMQTFPQTLHPQSLVASVSREAQTFNLSEANQKVVVAVDCGMKENILRILSRFPIAIRRVPYDYDYSEEPFDGIFLSNGPGDPTECPQTIAILRKAMLKSKPIFGICLGTQLMALAAGGKTYKLPYGHRGQNQPCMDLESRRCYITSQNHGYAVAEDSLPDGWKATFKNLNDDSVEGISHASKPFFSVQFHPEASPGPTDTLWLFEKFYRSL